MCEEFAEERAFLRGACLVRSHVPDSTKAPGLSLTSITVLIELNYTGMQESKPTEGEKCSCTVVPAAVWPFQQHSATTS